MSLPTIFLKKIPSEPLLTKYYVYYDEWTGSITNIGNREHKHIKDPYIITEKSIVGDLMKENINTKKYIVAEIEGSLDLIEKDKFIRLKKQENILTVIPVSRTDVLYDVNIIFYKSNWLLEINLNQDLIYKLTGKRYNNRYTENDNLNKSKIILYVTEKNNPHILYETIEIDPIDLFNNGYILVKLEHLRTKTTPLDISFFTRRIFKTYGLKYEKNYNTLDYHSRRRHRRKYTRIKDNSVEETTFSVIPSKEGWIIKSNFDNPKNQNLFRDIKIILFGETPFEFLDKIIIPYESIGNKQEFTVKTNVDLTKCNMLLGEEHKELSFKFEER